MSFKDVFLCLLVDPQVLNNNTVILTVEVQQDTQGSTITTAAGDQFAINTKRLKTQIRVRNGETVVARINGEQATLKKLYIEKDHIRLQPANPEMAPMIFRHADVEVLGIVKVIVRKT